MLIGFLVSALGGLAMQVSAVEGLIEQFVSGHADPVTYDYGALYFSPVGDELGTRLRADIAAALEAEGPRGGRSDFSRGTCVSHAVVTGWQAAERAGEPDVYLRWRSAVLAWHETVEASLATEPHGFLFQSTTLSAKK